MLHAFPLDLRWAAWTQLRKNPPVLTSCFQPIYPARCAEATVPSDTFPGSPLPAKRVLSLDVLPLVWLTPAPIPAPQGITLLSISQHLHFPTSWARLASAWTVFPSILHLQTTKFMFPGLAYLLPSPWKSSLTCSVYNSLPQWFSMERGTCHSYLRNFLKWFLTQITS